MDIAQQRTLVKDAIHVIVLIALAIVLWFVLVWSGIIHCSLIPGGCEAYWGVLRFNEGGQPRVLIVYGSGGLGNHELLRLTLENPNYVGVRARTMYLDQVTIGNLKEYDLVIVEEARKMSTDKLRAFVDYAVQGGHLVWTGDAAAELAAGDVPLYEHERSNALTCEDILAQTPHARIEDIDCAVPDNKTTCEELKAQKDVYIMGVDCVSRASAKQLGPWARKDSFGRIINFDQLLGVEYMGMFCEMSQSCAGNTPLIGMLKPEPERKHMLIKGMRQDLLMYGDFAVVEESGSAYTTRVLSVEHAGPIGSYEPAEAHILPVIVTSGAGQKIAYYALPPEQFVNGELPENARYYSLIENMYKGMVGFS